MDPGYSQRALDNLNIQYIDSLTSLLTLLRARWMIRNKQDPFNSIPNDYRKEFINDQEIATALGRLKDYKGLDDMLHKLYLYIQTR